MANITLPVSNNKFLESFTIENQSDNQLILNTQNTFVDKNIELNFNVKSGTVTVATTGITVTPSIQQALNGVDYTIQVSTTASIEPLITTDGFITNSNIAPGIITITGETPLTASIISTTAIIPLATENETITISSGYYPTDRSITVYPMLSGSIANISADGIITTTASVTISNTCTMEISNEPTIYYFSQSSTATTGVVQTQYSNNVPGYAEIYNSVNSNTVAVAIDTTPDEIIYLPVATLSTTFTGGILSTSTTQTNIEFNENTDIFNNGVKVSFYANKTAITATGMITTGYTTATNIEINADADDVTRDFYIKGITLTPPSSGTANFYLTFPNGIDDTITFFFEIDTAGNVTIGDIPV